MTRITTTTDRPKTSYPVGDVPPMLGLVISGISEANAPDLIKAIRVFLRGSGASIEVAQMLPYRLPGDGSLSAKGQPQTAAAGWVRGAQYSKEDSLAVRHGQPVHVRFSLTLPDTKPTVVQAALVTTGKRKNLVDLDGDDE